ncbi:MAG: helix-turn-helix transcriptional regulator [Clostridia bacterium]|nr:helix-turn-helix transcriptional regulator [Clostridia bacterium]
MIVTLTDSYMTTREEFQLTYGCQESHILLYLTEGSFSCNMDGSEWVARAGDLVYFDPETPMSRHVLEPLKFLYIKFQIKREELFSERAGLRRAVGGRVREDLLEIERLSSLRTQMGVRMREHYLNDLFLTLSKLPAPDEEIVTPLTVPKGSFAPIAYMKKMLDKELSLERIARACGVSVSALESKFRAMYGVSVYRYLIGLRMEEAQRLLAETSYTVTEIAGRCGYENLFYFCNVFKKHCGMTPTEYRKLHLI